MNGQGVLYALLGLVVFHWSGNFIVGKLALREFPPVLLSGIRVTLAGVLILPVYWWDRRRTPDTWERSELPLLIGLGIFGVALNQVFFVFGLSHTSVAHAAIIIGLNPIVVLLMAAALGQESVTTRKAAGMTIALVGVALLKAFETPPPGARAATWIGDGFVFLGTIAFALFTVFGKGATLRHNSVTVNTVAYVGAALAMAPITLWQARGFAFERVTWMGWSGLLYMTLFSSIVCYLIYYYALTHLLPSRVSAFQYLQPPLVAAMGVATLGEHVTLGLVAPALVIFAGVFLTERG